MFRLYLKDCLGTTVGRADFDASENVQSLVIAETVCNACSDMASGYELWRANELISAAKTIGSHWQRELQAYQQQIAIDTETALRDSRWLTSQSRTLLAEIAKLEAASGLKPSASDPDNSPG